MFYSSGANWRRWLQELARPFAPAFTQRQRSTRCRRPLLERLEDRLAPAITYSISGGTTVTFTTDASDTLFLRTDNTGILQYSSSSGSGFTDVTNFSLISGGSKTIQGNLNTKIAGNLVTDGQDLTINSDSNIEVLSNVVISTRDIADPLTGDQRTDPSQGDSGSLSLEVKNPDPFNPIPFNGFNSPSVTIDNGASLFAQAPSFAAGDITIKSTNTNLSLDMLVYEDIGVVTRDAKVTIDSSVTIDGATVTIEATGGDLALKDQLNQALNSGADDWVPGLIEGVTGYFTAYTALPVSFIYKKGTAEVTLGSNSQINATGDVTLQSAASADATGEAIYFRGTRFGGAFAFNWAESSATTTIDSSATIVSQGGVLVKSEATNTNDVSARVTQNIGSSIIGDPVSNTNNIEVAGVVAVSDLTSHATVSEGASITAVEGVTVHAMGTYDNESEAGTASYYSGQVGITFLLDYSNSNVKATVDGEITVTGAAASVAPANFNPFTDVDFANSKINIGDTTGLSTGDRLAYSAGIGAPVPGLADNTTYYVIVLDGQNIQLAASKADALAGTFIPFGIFPTLTRTSDNLTLPITAINEVDNTIEYSFDTGLSNGDVVTYQAVTGQFIDGLMDGETYTVVSGGDPNNPFAFQLEDASNNLVTYNLSPKLIIGGDAYDFNVDPDANTFVFVDTPPSLDNGTAMVYQAPLRLTVDGLTDGETYYAITNPYDNTTIRFAMDPVSAALAFHEGENVYAQAYNSIYDPAYAEAFAAWLLANPGDTTGAEAAGDAAGLAAVQAKFNDFPEIQAIWFNAGTGSALNYPYLNKGTTYLAITDIDAATSTIRFAVPLDIQDGDEFIYTAVPSQYIGGLVDGDTYKAVFNPSLPRELKLTDLNDNPITFDLDPALLRSNGDALEFSVDSSGSIVLSNPPGDLVTGEELTYRAAYKTDFTGLVDGTVYYAIATSQSVIQLAVSESAAEAGSAIPGIAFTGNVTVSPIVIHLDASDTVMSGSQQTLTADSPGITIQADLSAKDTAVTKTKVGGQPRLGSFLGHGELLPAFRGILNSYLGKSPNTEENIKNSLPKDENGDPVTDGPSWQFAGSFAVQFITNTVRADVGGTAVLKSNQNVDVKSKISQFSHHQVESGLAQPTDNSDTKFSAATSVGISLITNTTTATVADGAAIDATQAFSVTSNLSYPYIFPIQSAADAKSFFESDPISGIGDFLNGKLGLDQLLFNSWVHTSVQAPNTSWTVGGSVGFLYYDNTSKATVGDVLVNQDPAYAGTSQSMSVTADTTMDMIYASGVFDLKIAPPKVLQMIRKGDKKAVYNPSGSTAAEGGVGGTIFVTLFDNTTEATVGGGSNILVSGGLTVKASTALVQVSLSQSGAQASNFGFAGTVVVLNVTNDTKAQIGPGAQISGSSIDVKATDSSVIVNAAGSVEIGEHIGFGFTATTNTFSRNTQAIFGAGSSDTPAASAVDLTGNLTVDAENTGALVSASFAAAIEENDTEQEDAAPNNAAQDPINDGIELAQINPNPDMNDDAEDLGVGDGNGADDAGSYGVAVSGDAAVNQVTKDNAYAYINDSLPTLLGGVNIIAAEVKVTASNDTGVGAFAGTVAAAAIDGTNVAVAGSFTINLLESETKAYIENAAMIAASLKAEATRSGDLVSITAGVAAASGDSGVGIGGSISVTEVTTHTISAYLDNVEATLSGDTNVTATDKSTFVSVGGGVGYGGKAGIGPAVAVNNIASKTEAYVTGSTLTATGGELNITATNENPTSDARIVALTGTAGISSSGAGAAAMFSINILANTVQAYLADSTFANSGAQDVTISATDKSWIISFGLAIGIGDDAGVGFAFGFNQIERQTDSGSNVPNVTATIDNSGVSTGGALTVEASSTYTIGSATISGAGAENVALAGMASFNFIETTTDAHIANSPQTGAGPRIDIAGAITVKADDTSLIVSIAGEGAGSLDQSAFGAGFSYNLIENNIKSYIDGSSVESGSTLTVTATSSPELVAIAISGDGADDYAGGGAITVNRIINTTEATISGGSDVVASGAVTLKATDSSAMYVFAAGGAGGTIASGGAGVSANSIGDISDSSKRNVVQATIDASTVKSTNDQVIVDAGFSSPSSLPSSPITIANGMGDDADDPLDVDLPAEMTTQIFNLSLGGAGAQNFAFGGAISLNYFRNTIGTQISSSSTVTAGTNIVLAAGDESEITSLAGAFSLAVGGGNRGAAGTIGVSVAVNDISNTITSNIDASTGTADQAVSLSAETSPSIFALTIAGTGTGNSSQGGGIAIAVAGAGSGNTIDNTVSATISGGSEVSSGNAQAVQLAATDSSKITADGGGVTFIASGGEGGAVGVAVGAAAAVNTITNTITASIDSSTVTSAGDVLLAATSSVKIFALTIGIAGAIASGEGGGISFEGAGSGSGNTVTNTVKATIVDSDNSVTTSGSGAVILEAKDYKSTSDKSTITAAAGAAAIGIAGGDAGASVAIGVSAAVNEVTNKTTAEISNSSVTSAAEVTLSAESTAAILAVTVAGGVGVGETTAAFAGAGAGSGNTITNTVQALISDGSEVASGAMQAVTLSVSDKSNITADAGGVSIGYAGGKDASVAGAIGAGAATNTITNTATASVNASTVHSDGAVAVAADSSPTIFTVTVGIQGTLATSQDASFDFGGAGAGSGNEINNTVEASIVNKSLVTSANGGDISVTATDDATITAGSGVLGLDGSSGGIIAASASVGASIVINNIGKSGNTVQAYIDDSTVTSDGDLTVEASSTSKITSVTIGASADVAVGDSEISVSAALSGVGASTENTIDIAIQAYIQNDSQVQAHDVTVSASDHSTIEADAVGGTIDISGGTLSVSVSIAVALGTNTVLNKAEAFIGLSGVTTDTTKITASGTTDVIAEGSNSSITALVVAASITGAISMGAALVGTGANGTNATRNSDKNRTIAASVRGGSTVNANGKATISASDDTTITSKVGSGDLSFAVVGASIGVSLTTNTIGDDISAYIDSSTVSSTTSDVDVTATATTKINALSVGTALSLSLGGAGAGSNAKSTDNAAVAAYTSGPAEATASSGAVNISATTTSTVTASAPGGAAGLVAVGAMFATAEMNGSTSASIGEGGTVNAGSVSVTAQASPPNDDDTVNASVLVVDVAAFAGLGANSTATVDHDVQAYIGPEANDTPTGAATTITVSAGSVDVTATSMHSATTEAKGGSGSLIDVGVLLTTTTLKGSTKAYVGGAITIDGGDISVSANTDNTSSGTAFMVDISAASGDGANTSVTDSHSAAAYIGNGSDITVNNGSATVQATTVATATATNTGGVGAAIAEVSALVTSSEVSGDTQAYVGEGSTVTAESLIVAADYANRNVSSTSTIIGVSVLEGGDGSHTTSTVKGTVEAYAGPQGTNANTSTTTLNITGDINITADSVGSPSVTATVGAGGLLASAAGLTSTAEVSSTVTRASVGAGTEITVAGLNIIATATDKATNSSTVGSGGLLTGNGTNAQANVTPTIEAFIGANVSVNASGSVQVEATSVRAEAHATGKAYGGGGLEVGIPQATVTTEATVTAYIGSQATVIAVGDVSVNAAALSESSADQGDVIDSSDPAEDTVFLESHGQKSGDVVVFQAGSVPLQSGNENLAAPGDTREMQVVVADADNFSFGAEFQGTATDASTPLGVSGVDVDLDVIRFTSPHTFVSGDSVNYNPNGNGGIIADPNASGPYFVRVIDPFTIKITQTYDEATEPLKTFSTDDLSDGKTFHINNDFTDGEFVTYRAPEEVFFLNTYVNVELDADGDPVTNNQGEVVYNDNFVNIYLGDLDTTDVDLYTGDQVIYYTDEEPGTPAIAELENGHIYYIVRDPYSYRLARTQANAFLAEQFPLQTQLYIPLTPDRTNASTVNLFLVPTGIGGLQDGKTYQVTNADSSKFELIDPDTGLLVTGLDKTVSSPGDHQMIGREYGLPLQPALGTQDFHLDLTNAVTAADNNQLFSTDVDDQGNYLPLRSTDPPSGDGKAHSSASGGAGGFLQFDFPYSETTVKPTVTAYVGAQLVDAGGSVQIVANTETVSDTQSDSSAGGFVEVGTSNSTSNFTNTGKAYVGNDVSGTIDGSGVTINAGGDFKLASTTSLTTTANAKAHGGGFIAVVDAETTVSVTNTNSTTVGANAIISAATVELLADVTQLGISQTPDAKAGGLFGSATAKDHNDVDSTASVIIGGGSTRITGFDGVDVRALNQNLDPDADARAKFDGIGPEHADNEFSMSLTTSVNADAGATVIAGPRLPGSPLASVSGYDELALYVQAQDENVDHTSQSRTIIWNANVELFSIQSAELVVDENGVIQTAINISVNDGPGNPTRTSGQIQSDPILVNDITAETGQALFLADDKVSNTAEYPLFTVLQNVPTITIINQSDKDLQIQTINVASDEAPSVTLDSNSVEFMFDIATGAGPTVIDIENRDATQNASNIILSGLINNPVGETNISNVRGSIVSTGSAAIIRTNVADIEASAGIGEATERVNVDLVRSEDSSTGDLRNTELTAVAGDDIYLNLTGRLRDNDATPFTIYVDEISAGGNVDLTLQSSVSDPASGEESSGLLVIDKANNTLSKTYYDHFYPDNNPPPPADGGLFGDTSNATTIDSAYQFGGPGLIAGGNIIVTSVNSQPSDPRIDITGFTELTGSGYIDTLTNGDVTYTEAGGGVMRVRSIQSTDGNVSLTNPDLATTGQDLEVLDNGLIDASGTMELLIGDDVTTGAGSLLTAGTSITLMVDYQTADDIGAVVNINGSITSPLTTITGNVHDDVINLNFTHGINAGVPDTETNVVSIDGAEGNNQLKVDDSSELGADTGAMTFDTVTGLGMGGQGLQYTSFAELEVDLSQGGTTFTVYSTNAGTATLVNGGDSSDFINVGSSLDEDLAGDPGDLNDIQGQLTIIGNGGSDEVEVNDHANADGDPATPTNDPAYGFNYLITPTSVSNLAPTVNTVPDRTFAGIIFNASGNAAENTVTYLRLDCTDRTNQITVQPSLLTTFFVNGNLPVPGECRIDGGDYLQLDTSALINGTGYREIHITEVGKGYWDFIGPDGTVYAQEVQFESIERFNHVGAVAAGTGAGFSGLPYVTVFDSETGEIRGRFLAYETWYVGGVRVATADVNCDGFPDIITAPGSDHLPIIHVYSGSPDANGDYPFELIGSFDVFTPAMQKGINLAAGDINGDGGHEIVVAADAGYLPEVEVYTVDHTSTTVTASLETSFLAYEAGFRGGLSVAVGDLNNDGLGELVTARGAGGFPTVNIYSFNAGAGDFNLVKTFDAFPDTFQRGMDVAIGDYNDDGIRDIIVGAGAGWTPTVNVYSGENAFNGADMELISSFLAYDSGYRGGVKVAAKTIDGDDPDFPEQVNIFTGFGPGNPTRTVREFTYTGVNTAPHVVDAYDADLYYLFGLNFGSGGTASTAVFVGGISSFTDDDGDIYTVQLRGGGAVQVLQDDMDGDGRGSIASIIVTGADARRTSLTVSVLRNSSGDRAVSIGSIVSDSSLYRIDVRNSDLVGDGITVNGVVRDVRIRDMTGSALVAGGSATDTTSITAGVISAGTIIDMGSTLSSFRAEAVSNASIAAAAIRTMFIRGNVANSTVTATGPVTRFYAQSVSDSALTVGGELTLLSANAIASFDITAASIRTMFIRGNATHTTVTATGPVTSFYAQTVSDSALTVGGELTTLRAGAVANADIAAEAIRAMIVRGELDNTRIAVNGSVGSFYAATVSDSEFSLAGDLTTFRANAVADTDIAAAAIRSMYIRGDFAMSTVALTGSIASFVARTFTDSHLHAGFTPTGPLAGVFNSNQEVRSFRVTGSSLAFARSSVAASTIGYVTLGSIDLFNGNTPFGILANVSITRVTVNRSTQPVPRDELTDDFEIRI